MIQMLDKNFCFFFFLFVFSLPAGGNNILPKRNLAVDLVGAELCNESRSFVRSLVDWGLGFVVA